MARPTADRAKHGENEGGLLGRPRPFALGVDRVQPSTRRPEAAEITHTAIRRFGTALGLQEGADHALPHTVGVRAHRLRRISSAL